jgi:SOUL heme-binding protein
MTGILMRTTKIMVTLLVSFFGACSMAIEEPVYSVLDTTTEYEVRRYQPYIVAEVDVDGGFNDSGKAAFQILAGYIFGGNRAGEKMQMTAPVETNSMRMSMTVPVISYVAKDPAGEPDYAYLTKDREKSAEGWFTYAFVMESKYTMDTLPVPNDPRIRLKENPARVLAVHRYSGRWTEANYRENKKALQSSLRRDGLTTTAEPLLARYNSPFTPWFLRRNEVMVEIVWPNAPPEL